MKQTYFKPHWLLLLFVMFSSFIYSQKNEDVNDNLISGKKVENKFNAIIEKAIVFKEYKLIKTVVLDEFRENLTVFLTANQADFANLNSQLREQDVSLSNLNTQLAALKNENISLNNSVTAISLFGMSFQKGTYNFIMWTFLLLIAFAAFYFAYRFMLANKITRNSKVILAEVEDEYQLFKQNSIEREQKLRRQLQDEIIKYRKLQESSQ